jgi:hypothetical protein
VPRVAGEPLARARQATAEWVEWTFFYVLIGNECTHFQGQRVKFFDIVHGRERGWR